MRVISLFKPDRSLKGPPPSAEMAKLIEDMTKSGVLLATEGFSPSPEDVKVRLSDGEFTVTDGPFTEAKELIGGFAVMEVKSREEAIEYARVFLRVIGGGECEIHPLCAAPDLAIENVARR